MVDYFLTYKAGGEVEELFGLEDGVALAFDFAELLDAVLEYFDFL